MSLIHLHPATLNPRVHYISEFFHPVEAQLAAMARAAPVEPRPKEKPTQRRVNAQCESRRSLRAAPPMAIQVLCTRLSLRLQCGHLLHALWRARGEALALVDLGYSRSSIFAAISEIRRALPPDVRIDSLPGIGWAMPVETRAPITALLAEHGDA